MRTKLIILALLGFIMTLQADTSDGMVSKVSDGQATGLTPVVTGAHALVDKSNNILLKGYPGVLRVPKLGPYSAVLWHDLVFATPTAKRTITFPNSSGTVALNPYGASIEFEGATADAYETTLTVVDPTADRTVTVPNATGTVDLRQGSTTTALTADNQAVTPGVNTVLQLTSDSATDTERTFTLSATGAITGQVYVVVGPAANACEIADTGIQKLSAAWSPGATDTLTLLFDGTNFLELARSNN